MLERVHAALRSTRGAAVAVARDRRRRAASVRFAGVGNIAGCDRRRRRAAASMVSHNGTVGHDVRRDPGVHAIRGRPAPLLVLHSDGLAIALEPRRAIPGWRARHPGLIAGVLYRDFARGRDDVTVVVGAGAAADEPARS